MGRKILPGEYYGCDVVREVLNGPNVWCGDHRSAKGPFDLCVMAGIFNVGYTWTDVVRVITDIEAKVKTMVLSFALGPARPPFTTFPARMWGELLSDVGDVTMHGPHGCSYTAVVKI